MANQDRAVNPLPAPQPEFVEVTRDGTGLTLAYRWFRPMHILMLLFCVFWDGFLVFWYRSVLAHPTSPTDIAVWFPLIHVAAGIGLTYATLAGFINRTRVVVRLGEIVVWHGPLPWIGNAVIPTSELAQLYCEEPLSKTRSGTRANYNLYARTQDGRRRRVVGWLPDGATALYLEQEIEKELSIADQPVIGEMKK